MVIHGEYKGNPTITIKNDESEKYGFTFGLGKAQKILAHIEEIQAFVATHEGDEKGSSDATD